MPPEKDATTATTGQDGQQDASQQQQASSADAQTTQDMVSRVEMEKVIGERQSAKDRARKAEEAVTELNKKLTAVPDAKRMEAFTEWETAQAEAAKKKALNEGDADALVETATADLRSQIQAKDTAIERQRNQLKGVLCEQALRKAAEASNAHSPDQVVALLRGRVQMQETPEGGFLPDFRSADSTPMYDGKGERVTDAGTFVSLFLGLPENANLVRSKAAPGSGAQPAGGQTNQDGIPANLEAYNALTPEERQAAAMKMTTEQRNAMLGLGTEKAQGFL